MVDPFAQGPVVPVFPEQAAGEAAGEGGEGAGEIAVLPVAQHGGAAELAVERIEEKDQRGPEREVGDGIGIEEWPEEHGHADEQNQDFSPAGQAGSVGFRGGNHAVR